MKTQEIHLMDCVNGTSTNAEGFQLYTILLNAINDDIQVKLSLKDSTPMSSSFMNSSFGELVEIIGMEKFKQHISLVNFKPSQAEYIKKYLANLRLHH